MTVIGFHASHEQMHPTELLDAVQRAEQAGFTAAGERVLPELEVTRKVPA